MQWDWLPRTHEWVWMAHYTIHSTHAQDWAVGQGETSPPSSEETSLDPTHNATFSCTSSTCLTSVSRMWYLAVSVMLPLSVEVMNHSCSKKIIMLPPYKQWCTFVLINVLLGLQPLFSNQFERNKSCLLYPEKVVMIKQNWNQWEKRLI